MDFYEVGQQAGAFMAGLLVFGIYLSIKIFYLLTLQKALEQVAIERRGKPIGQIWLELVPILGIVWQFFNVNRVMRAINSEFNARGMNNSSLQGTLNLGKVSCILSCCGIIPLLGGLCRLGSLVCWIIFWVKIHNLKNDLSHYKLHQINDIN